MVTDDAELSLRHRPGAILRPDFCGLDARDPRGNRVDLVRAVPGTGRFLFASVKIVCAADAQRDADEIWVCTAHPLKAGFSTQRRYRDSLQAVDWRT